MENILIIDDETPIRSMVRLILERAGYTVREAQDGIEGIRVFRETPADLIITDLIMPNKDGIGMIIELKKDFPAVEDHRDVRRRTEPSGGLPARRPETGSRLHPFETPQPQ